MPDVPDVAAVRKLMLLLSRFSDFYTMRRLYWISLQERARERMGFLNPRVIHSRGRFSLAALTLALTVSMSGCTGPIEYVRNGFKVGPNYHGTAACTEKHWIDANDARVRQEPTDLVQWWGVFHDPALDRLIVCASAQNLTLREAGYRILEARAQLGISEGNLFPQMQTATGSY